MRGILLTVAVAAVGLILVGYKGDDAQAQGRKRVQKLQQPPFVHTVIFYLKKDAPADETDAIIRDAHDLLGKIPSVRSLRVGRPAEKAISKVVVTDYQVGLLVLFENQQGEQTYQNHPLHLQFVDKHKKYMEKVNVYDFVNQ